MDNGNIIPIPMPALPRRLRASCCLIEQVRALYCLLELGSDFPKSLFQFNSHLCFYKVSSVSPQPPISQRTEIRHVVISGCVCNIGKGMAPGPRLWKEVPMKCLILKVFFHGPHGITRDYLNLALLTFCAG